MSKFKISIIMPAYNAEKTIKKAIDSCLNQSLKETELIIVDDCSTDSTRDIMIPIRNNNPDRVKILFQEKNAKQGAARNRGFREAEGEYILFVDSDDWIERDACRKLYECAIKEECDEVVGDYALVYDTGEKKYIKVFESVRGSLGKQTINSQAKLLQQPGYFWCKLYKKEFLERIFPEGKLFPEFVRYEDSAFNTLTTIQADKIQKIDYCFYNYYQNPNSTVRDISAQLDKIEIAKYLMDTKFAKNEYKDLILYKCTVLCGAALLYGILHLYGKQKELCKIYLEKINKMMPEFYEGGRYQNVQQDMRKHLEENWKHHKRYLLKLTIYKILW